MAFYGHHVHFEVRLREFEDALRQYAITTGKSFQEVVIQQSRLVVKKLIAITPPQTTSGKNGKKSGENSVRSDIGKVFRNLGNTKWENQSLDKLWRAGNFEGVKKALSNSPNYSKMPVSKYEILKDPQAKIHQSARAGRFGPVPNSYKTKYAVAASAAYKRYVKEVQKHVGRSKSGWLASAVRLGAKTPVWISRHGQGRGSFIDRTSDPNSPNFSMINNAISGKSTTKVKNVLKFQTKMMHKDITRILAGGKFRF